jgi:hypothetical protein
MALGQTANHGPIHIAGISADDKLNPVPEDKVIILDSENNNLLKEATLASLGAGVVSGIVDTYAELPTPAADYDGKFYMVRNSTGGLWTWAGRYKYPAGPYTPNSSNVWEQAPFSVKVSEDAQTLVSIPSGSWADYIAAAIDINAGDMLIYDNKLYENQTGTQGATAPDSDSTNWDSNVTVDKISIGPNGESITFNSTDYTIDVETGLGPVLQVGQEMYTVVYNGTASQIDNGHVCNVVASFNGFPSVSLADASAHNTIANVSVATMDIPPSSYGITTSFGKIRGIDTTALSGSEFLVYVSTDGSGHMVRTRPEFPDYRIILGGILTDSASGVIFVDIRESAQDTFFNGWDGCIRESIDFLVSSDGATITGSLNNGGDDTRDLTLCFSDGFTILDTTPAATITLTAGTDANPQTNYVYIPKSTKVLTISTADWPTDVEHIKVAIISLRSAATTQLDGAFRNQNWNDHVKKENDNGHLLHITEKLRKFEAQWESGTSGSSTIGAGGASASVASTAGEVYQLHRQSFPVLDTTPYTIDAVSTGSKTITISGDGDLTNTFPDGRYIKVNGSTGNDGLYTIASTTYSDPDFIITVNETIPSAIADGEIYDEFSVPNDFTTAYYTDWDVTGVTTDASGNSLTNTSYSMVMWGVINKSGQPSHLMLNAPAGTYSKNFPEQAVTDAQNHSVYTIPSEFGGVGFLIARFTYIDNGGVLSLYDTEDLRGKIPNTTAGGGAGGAGVTDFTGLTDTPSAYTGQAGRVLTTNSGETALEFNQTISTSSTAIQLNSGGTDIDTTIKGLTDDNLLTVDAGLDTIGIGKAADSAFKVCVGGGGIDTMRLEQADADAELNLYRDDATINAGNDLGRVTAGGSAGGTTNRACEIKMEANQTWSSGNKGSRITFYVIKDANTTSFEAMRIDGTGIYMYDIKSGATQVAAGANAGEVWKTASHATLPDNVLLIGV